MHLYGMNKVIRISDYKERYIEMKKILIITLVACFALAAFTACAGNTPAVTDNGETTKAAGTDAETAEATAEATTAAQQEIVVPDATLHYVPAEEYADKATAEANGLKTADNSNISSMFKESVQFDENWEVKLPDEFAKIDSYVFRVAQGQYIEEITIMKVADESGINEVKAIAEYRLNKQKNNPDFKLYDDKDGTNAKMIDTGKVVVIGNFVVYVVTENTEVSVLRAQKYVQDNPGCSAYELYKAVAKELF